MGDRITKAVRSGESGRSPCRCCGACLYRRPYGWRRQGAADWRF